MTVFVLLHYLVAEETRKCADSIINIVEGEKRIVIVDNCSPNNSFEYLSNYYDNNPEVVVIKNSSNAGYASGINFGYKYAYMSYNPDYIVCMNNDMEIKQKDFIKKIEQSFRDNGFFVLGPDIYSTSAKRHQNPESDSIRTIEDVEKHIRDIEKIESNTIKLKIKGCLRSIKFINTLYYRAKNESQSAEQEIKKNVTLHGSCLIFSRKFIDCRKNALNPGTFFYCESQILDYECLRDHMMSIYDPSIKIFHHEDIATNAVAGTYEKKILQKCERVKESLLFMKKMMEKDNENNG